MLPGVCECLQVRCCPGCVGVYRYDAVRGVWVSTGTMLSGVCGCRQVRCCPGCVYTGTMLPGVCGCLQVRCCPGCVSTGTMLSGVCVYRYVAVRDVSIGTMLSGVCVLCCGRPRIQDKAGQRVTTLCVNAVVGTAQMFTVSFMFVGWFWSFTWGIYMLILAGQCQHNCFYYHGSGANVFVYTQL